VANESASESEKTVIMFENYL